jgi:hypothetical protein
VNTQESLLSLSIAWTNSYLVGVGSLSISNLRYVGGYVGDLLISVRFVAGFGLGNVGATNLVEKNSREVVIQTTSSQLLLTTYVISNIVYPS